MLSSSSIGIMSFKRIDPNPLKIFLTKPMNDLSRLGYPSSTTSSPFCPSEIFSRSFANPVDTTGYVGFFTVLSDRVICTTDSLNSRFSLDSLYCSSSKRTRTFSWLRSWKYWLNLQQHLASSKARTRGSQRSWMISKRNSINT